MSVVVVVPAEKLAVIVGRGSARRDALALGTFEAVTVWRPEARS